MDIPRRSFFKQLFQYPAHRITELIVDAGHKFRSPEEAGLALARRKNKRSHNLMMTINSAKAKGNQAAQ